MSSILTPGERPGVWDKIGDLARRVGRLEAVPGGGGDGIQFDTDPQDGDWLVITTTGADPGGSGADGFNLNISGTDTDWRMRVARDWNIDSIGRDVNFGGIGRDLNCNVGNDYNLAVTRDANWSTGRNYSMIAAGSIFEETSDTTNGFIIALGAASVPFQIHDHSGNPIFGVTG